MKVKNQMKKQQQDEDQKRTTTSQKPHYRFFQAKYYRSEFLIFKK